MDLHQVIDNMHRVGLLAEAVEVRTVYARLQAFAMQLDKECFETVVQANNILAAQNKALKLALKEQGKDWRDYVPKPRAVARDDRQSELFPRFIGEDSGEVG